MCLLGGFSEDDVSLIWQDEHSILAWRAEDMEGECQRGSLGSLPFNAARSVSSIHPGRELSMRSCYELLSLMHVAGWQWKRLPTSPKSRLKLPAYVRGAEMVVYTAGCHVSSKYLACLIEASESETWGASIPHGQADEVYDRIRAGADWGTLKDELCLALQNKEARKKQKKNVEWSVDGAEIEEADIREEMSGALHQHAFELNEFDDGGALDTEVFDDDEQCGDLARMINELDSPSAESDVDVHGQLEEQIEAMVERKATAVETNQEAVAEAAAEPLASAAASIAQLQAVSGRWGIFQLGIKKPSRTNSCGGVEANCPLHAKSSKTGCKKFISCQSLSAEATLQATVVAKWWCVQGTEGATPMGTCL